VITTIQRYPLRPGLLAEWTLRPIASANPAEDFRAPSYLQEEHIRAAALNRLRGGAAGSWLATAFDLPGKAELGTLESVLLTLIDRHETLRSGFRFIGQRLRRFTYAGTEVELRPKVVGEFSRSEDIAAYLEARFDDATDPLDSVLPSVFATVLRPDSTTVLLASDHSRTDGYSIFLAPHEIHEIYAAALEGRRPDGLGQVGSHADFSHAERAKAATIGADHAGVVVWKNFLDAGDGALPEFPLERGVQPGQVPEWAGLHEQLMSAADADAFEAACKRDGGQLLTGLAAAAAITGYELGGGSDFRTTIPVHTRTHGSLATSIGWYVNSLPISINVSDTDDFGAVLGTATQALRKALPALRVPCSRAWELTGTVPLLRTMISFMDLRATPGNEHWKDWGVSGVGKPPAGDHVFFWFLRTHDGISVTAVFPETEVSQQNIPGYTTRLGQITNAIARTGTYRSALHSGAASQGRPAAGQRASRGSCGKSSGRRVRG
jgi:hypothetical protein